MAKKGLDFELPHYRFISCSYSQTMVPGIEEEAVVYEGVKCICLRTGQNKISALVNYDQSSSPDAVGKVLSAVFSGAEHVGISSPGFDSTPITKLYQESDIALYSALFLLQNRAKEYKVTNPVMMFPKALLNIEVAIREQKQEQINQFLDELCGACKAQDLLIDQIAVIYNQIAALYHKYYLCCDKMSDIEYLGYYQIACYYNSIDQLFEMVKSFFEKKTGEDIPITNELVKKILTFIDDRFTEDILLSFLSRKFNVSLGYLSALIKRKTGKTYTEYMISKRLQLAKELLKDTSLSIDEIVQRVGYKDYFYFNKLFKKYVGITPSKYRKI